MMHPSYWNLDASLHDAYLINTLQKPTNKKNKQSKFSRKLKHVHLIPDIFVKLVIPEGKKDIQSNNRLVKALSVSGDRESILEKLKTYKLPFRKTKHEQQCSIAAVVLNTKTKIATSISFPELHDNKLINQSLHVFDININHYDMIICCGLINSLGINIHGPDMNMHWDDSAIPWRDIDSTINIVIAVSQYNAPFNS